MRCVEDADVTRSANTSSPSDQPSAFLLSRELIHTLARTHTNCWTGLISELPWRGCYYGLWLTRMHAGSRVRSWQQWHTDNLALLHAPTLTAQTTNLRPVTCRLRLSCCISEEVFIHWNVLSQGGIATRQQRSFVFIAGSVNELVIKLNYCIVQAKLRQLTLLCISYLYADLHGQVLQIFFAGYMNFNSLEISRHLWNCPWIKKGWNSRLETKIRIIIMIIIIIKQKSSNVLLF